MPARHKRRRKLQVGDRLFLFWHDDWEKSAAPNFPPWKTFEHGRSSWPIPQQIWS